MMRLDLKQLSWFGESHQDRYIQEQDKTKTEECSGSKETMLKWSQDQDSSRGLQH